MSGLTIVILLALIATIAVLAMGVRDLVGGEERDEHSARMMYMRVLFQGAAFLLVLIALLLSR